MPLVKRDGFFLKRWQVGVLDLGKGSLVACVICGVELFGNKSLFCKVIKGAVCVLVKVRISILLLD